MTTQAERERWTIPLHPERGRHPSHDGHPAVQVVIGRQAPAAPAGRTGSGFIRYHPRYRAWLQKCGVIDAESALQLLGEIVCGHPDRHVARVELTTGIATRIAFLKREHHVPSRTRRQNRRAGFGPVARCEREAATLTRLEEAGLPGPQWLAYGEDGRGRAFLLIEELAGAVEARRLLSEYKLTTAERNRLFHEAGAAIAELHVAGFATPELAIKHLFVHPAQLSCTLVDWQSTPRRGPFTLSAAVKSLAQLHATLAGELASTRERLRFLAAYTNRLREAGAAVPARGKLRRAVQKQAARLWDRSSIRSQRQPVSMLAEQRLVWLKDEEVVAIAELAAVWPRPVDGEPFYTTECGGAELQRERFTFDDGRAGVVVRFRTRDILGRLWAAWRERSWRSPAAKAARLLFHLQRHGIPAPKLLGFGQRVTSRFHAASFLAAEHSRALLPLRDALQHRPAAPWRAEALRACGGILRRLHDSGLRPRANVDLNDPVFAVDITTGAVAVGSPLALRWQRRVMARQRQADLRQVVCSLGSLSPDEHCLVAGGYSGVTGDTADR